MTVDWKYHIITWLKTHYPIVLFDVSFALMIFTLLLLLLFIVIDGW